MNKTLKKGIAQFDKRLLLRAKFDQPLNNDQMEEVVRWVNLAYRKGFNLARRQAKYARRKKRNI